MLHNTQSYNDFVSIFRKGIKRYQIKTIQIRTYQTHVTIDRHLCHHHRHRPAVHRAANSLQTINHRIKSKLMENFYQTLQIHRIHTTIRNYSSMSLTTIDRLKCSINFTIRHEMQMDWIMVEYVAQIHRIYITMSLIHIPIQMKRSVWRENWSKLTIQMTKKSLL